MTDFLNEMDEESDIGLELCKDLVSGSHEALLYKLLTEKPDTWVNIHQLYHKHFPTDNSPFLTIPTNINARWFVLPSSEINSEVNNSSEILAIVFLNADTLETTNAIYYAFSSLEEKMSCL